jgi:hypothetical protein
MDTEAWKASIKEYEQEKRKVLPLPKTERATTSNIIKLEGTYNPILQTYTNSLTENSIKTLEAQRTIETLAKNQDKALRYEQTYNIINLENKLKGLESLPNYPIEKLPNYKNRRLGNTTNTNYNIISNYDFADHHFLPPDLRPPRPVPKKNIYKINSVEYKDYNIINNRYLQDHDQKSKLDLESCRQEAADEYWKTHDFDPIRCSYVDDKKENDYKQAVKDKEKTHGLDRLNKLPHGVKYSEGALYQPIGMKIIDQERLEEIDLKNKNAKKRFEDRYDIEKDYRAKDINNQEIKKYFSINKISHERFLGIANRGYNIITHAPFQGLGAEKLQLPHTSQKTTVWEKITSESNGKNNPPQKSYSVRSLRTKGF